jgi:3' terminal RNA ribose 2'-O-methyltransferase Hen1
VILTISSTDPNARDLSFLFHKHPERVQEFALSFGRALVFYPRYNANACEIALVLDLDPLRLAGRGERAGLPLYPYVNDRPYVASSFLSVALAEVFKSALNGHCKTRPELVNHAFAFEIKLPCLPVRGSTLLPSDLFGPLGYRVSATAFPLDPAFPEWGESPYVACALAATVTLKDLLNHMYVLIPVLDDEKHYWIDEQEVEKLLRRGETWLAKHPKRELIVARYLKRRRPLVAAAESRLVADEAGSEEPNADDGGSAPLHAQRLEAVATVLRARGGTRILDLVAVMVSSWRCSRPIRGSLISWV